MEKFRWHTNRLLFLLEPGKYYSTIYFWNEQSSEFLCYYINFQLPFQLSHCGIDTLDLDLDLIVHPDFTYEWKDIDDYQKAIEHEIIFPGWVQEIVQQSSKSSTSWKNADIHSMAPGWTGWLTRAGQRPNCLKTGISYRYESR